MSAVEVAYEISGAGPPLYMVHGIGSRRSTWRGLVEELATDFTCVAYDLRGHGDSPVPEPPYTLDELVEDLDALRQRLGHERIHVIGHSLGGMIGPAFARAHPDRVASLGLLSTAANRSGEDRARLQAVTQRMRTEGIAEVLPALVNRWYTDEFASARPDLVEHRIAQVEGTPPEVFLAVFDVYAGTEMAPWLHEIDVPCLIVTGEDDPACGPRHNRFIADEIPDSELMILDGLRHSILVEAPDRVAPVVGEFLRRRTG